MYYICIGNKTNSNANMHTYIFFFEHATSSFIGSGPTKEEAYKNANIREDLDESELGMTIKLEGNIPLDKIVIEYNWDLY